MSETSEGRRWRLVSSRRVIDDRWLRLDAECLETDRGTILDPWYVARPASWACTVARCADRFILVEQYRRGADAWVLELPAGNIDAGELPGDAAVRELAEETGYRVEGPLTPLGSWFPEPAHSTARAHGFAVRVALEPQAARPDAGESIRVRLLSADDIRLAIDQGRFCHAAQIAFWMTARDRGLT